MSKIKYLSQDEVVNIAPNLSESISIIEGVFKEHGAGEYENPPKPGIYPQGDAFIHAMPGYLKRKQIAGMKWVSVFSSNPKQGLPAATGLIVLNDVETGFPTAVMDCAYITALRTAAASAVGAKYLAPKNAKTIGIVGAGVQGRYNLMTIKEVVPTLEKVKIADRDEAIMDGFIETAGKESGVEVEKCSSLQDTIEGCDIVVTATGVLHEVIFKEEWVKKGALVLPVHAKGWEPDALRNADKFVCDDWAQLSKSVGQEGGFYYPMPELYSELGPIVLGEKPGRENNEETIFNINYGMAIHDVTMATDVLKRAADSSVGSDLELAGGKFPFM